MNKYLVRYSGEIGTKSKSVRWSFTKALGANIQAAIRSVHGIEVKKKCLVEVRWDNIMITSPVRLERLLARIPGISNFSQIHEIPFNDPETFLDTAFDFFKDAVKGKTFAVRCKKNKSHIVKGSEKAGKIKAGQYSRMEFEALLGERLVSISKVNLSNPEITCFIEIKEDKAFLSSAKFDGMMGLPIGTQGKALTLYSGGIDSPVAAWMAYKVGMDQDFIYFDLGGDDQKDLALQTGRFLRAMWGHGSSGKLILIDFSMIIKEILFAKRSYQNIILKVFFYLTAGKLAEKYGYDALVTGESIGQVSTQTLKNLNALDPITPTIVIRPLSTFSKEEIIRYAERIGTFELAYKGKEYCAITGKNVVTEVTNQKLLNVLEKLNTDLIDEVIARRKIIDLTDADNSKEYPASKKVVIPKGYKVIDLRSLDEFKKFSIAHSKNVTFNEAWADYVHWDKKDKYFLVCSEGSTSAILAVYMGKDGFTVEHLKGGIKKAKT